MTKDFLEFFGIYNVTIRITAWCVLMLLRLRFFHDSYIWEYCELLQIRNKRYNYFSERRVFKANVDALLRNRRINTRYVADCWRFMRHSVQDMERCIADVDQCVLGLQARPCNRIEKWLFEWLRILPPVQQIAFEPEEEEEVETSSLAE